MPSEQQSSRLPNFPSLTIESSAHLTDYLIHPTRSASIVQPMLTGVTFHIEACCLLPIYNQIIISPLLVNGSAISGSYNKEHARHKQLKLRCRIAYKPKVYIIGI